MATATVAAELACAALAVDGTCTDTTSARGMVTATGGAGPTIPSAAAAVASAKAAANASTNAVQLSHLALGSLASPRRITSSTEALSAVLRELAGGGSRWTWA